MAAAACWTLVAGCTTPAQSISSAAPSAAATSSPGRAIALSCADAGSGSAPDSTANLTLDGLTLVGLSGEGSAAPATDVGLRKPPGDQQYFFFKTPAFLRMGASPITVELASSSSATWLVWVPAHVWTRGSSVDVRPWMASAVTFHGCQDRDTTYFGGLLATDPQHCLVLRIQRPSEPIQTTRIRLNGAPC